jgi:uncharacterized protein (DUF983 family)
MECFFVIHFITMVVSFKFLFRFGMEDPSWKQLADTIPAYLV